MTFTQFTPTIWNVQSGGYSSNTSVVVTGTGYSSVPGGTTYAPAPPENELDWLRRRVAEICDLVAA